MKLSDAILKGAQQRPQCRLKYFAPVEDGTMGSCALGAAYEAVFGPPPSIEEGKSIGSRLGELSQVYPELDNISDLNHQIQHRNDGLRHTREQIAAWLAEQGL